MDGVSSGASPRGAHARTRRAGGRCTGTSRRTACRRCCRVRRRRCCWGPGSAGRTGVEDRPVALGDGTDLDVRDVVLEAPPVRERRRGRPCSLRWSAAGSVGNTPSARQSPSLSSRASAVHGAIAVFSRSRSALTGPVLFTPGTPWSRISDRSVRPVVSASGSDGVERVDEARELRVEVVLLELLVVLGLLAVPVVLEMARDDHLVDEGVPEPGHLDPRAAPLDVAVGVDGPLGAWRLAEAQIADRRMSRVAAQLADRDLDGDGVGVEAGHTVDAVGGIEREQVGRVERPQAAEVEDRAEVDEERVVARAGVDLTVRRASWTPACASGRVVGRGPRADVGRDGLAGCRRARVVAVLDPGDRVGLADQEVGVGQRRDLAAVVQERRDAVLARAAPWCRTGTGRSRRPRRRRCCRRGSRSGRRRRTG